MSTLLQTLASYVPAHIIRRANEDPGRFPAAATECIAAAVLFADVKGFTALTERLAARGTAGAEDLARLLNDYLGQLVEDVLKQGGDVVKFAGDAVLAIWPVNRGADVAAAVDAAAACAAGIQAKLNDYPVAEGIRLSMKLAIGAGEVVTGMLGGVFGRWELTIAGPPLTQVGIGNECAHPGDVVCSAEAWKLVKDRWEGEAVAQTGCVRLVRPLASASPRAAIESSGMPELRPEAAQGVRAFIPAAIRTRLDAGQSDWLAELRRVTVLFLNLHDFNHATPLAQAQEVMCTLQASLYRYEGSINKISIDDKGASLVAALGLPPLAHGDDPVRGVRAALAMKDALDKLNLRCSIGVATGLAFCGSVGSPNRREYTLMGDIVNLAARLMQAAKGGILCDEPTARPAGQSLSLTPLEPIRVKGKQEPVAVFRPSATARPRLGEAGGHAVNGIVGRDAEREALEEVIASLLEKTREGAVNRVVIEGEPGIGKSILLADFLSRARSAGARVLSGAADAVESATPYHALRPVFSALFGVDALPASSDVAAQRTRVLDELPDDPLVFQCAPLLETVLPFAWPDNEFTAPLAGKARADRTHDLLVRVLLGAAAEAPLVLGIDDVQWLDTGSLAVLALAAERVRPAVLALATRPLTDPVSPEFAALLRGAGVRSVRLDRLSSAATVTLACKRLGVEALPQKVADRIGETADGNPFFSEELAYAMRDAGFIRIEGSSCHIAPGAEDVAAWQLPHTVRGVVLGRIDRLTPQQQLTIKVASVVGRVFSYNTVYDVYPLADDRETIRQSSEILRSLDLTPLERPAPELLYAFRHIVTQEVAYDLMAYEQRRRLHRAVAEWYEKVHTNDLARFYPFLGYHWSKAAEGTPLEAEPALKAVDYLQRAGDQAVRQFVNREAVGFYEQALDLLGRLPATPDRAGRELRVLLALGAVLIATRGYAAPEVEQAYARAKALCEEVGDDQLLFAALRGLWALRTGRADYREALSIGQRMLALAERSGEASSLLEAYRALGNTYFWLGDFAAAQQRMGQAIVLYAPDEHRTLAFLFAQDPNVANRGMQSWPLALTGHPAEALDRAREAVDYARSIAHPYSLGYALVHDMCCRQFLLDVDATMSRSGEVIALAGEHSFPNWLLAGMALRGWALARSGKTEEGIGQVKAVIGMWQSVGCELCVPYFFSLLADACLEAGKYTDGLEAVQSGLWIGAKNDDRWLDAELLRLKGELLRRQGAPADEVINCWTQATQIARAQNAKLFELRTAVSLAGFEPAEAAGESAIHRLGELCESFSNGPDIIDLRNARALRATAAARAHQDSSSLAGAPGA